MDVDAPQCPARRGPSSAGRCLTVLLAALAVAVSGAAQAGAEECPADARWGLVIDAGSSGSRLHLYCWKSGGDQERVWIEDRGSFKTEPGIADAECSLDPEEAAATLEPLIEHALEVVREPSRRAVTPLALLATGGLRRCPVEHRRGVLEAIREALDETPFAVVAVEQATGDDEGRYGWLGVNYLRRRAAGPEDGTTGALDLGGASTQITFSPPSCPGEHRECGEQQLEGTVYPLYTHSYLGWGQDEAMRRVGSRACSLRGYRPPGGGAAGRGPSVGRGRYKACKRAIRRTLAEEARRRPPCRGSCSRLGVYQPPPVGDFQAFSAYAYTTDFFELGAPLSLPALEAAGKAHCKTRWSEIEAECATGERSECNPDRLNRYCFAAAYIVILLHDVYGFPYDTRQIVSSNQVGDAEIGWTLGVMVEIAAAATEPGGTAAGGAQTRSTPLPDPRSDSSPRPRGTWPALEGQRRGE